MQSLRSRWEHSKPAHGSLITNVIINTVPGRPEPRTLDAMFEPWSEPLVHIPLCLILPISVWGYQIGRHSGSIVIRLYPRHRHSQALRLYLAGFWVSSRVEAANQPVVVMLYGSGDIHSVHVALSDDEETWLAGKKGRWRWLGWLDNSFIGNRSRFRFRLW